MNRPITSKEIKLVKKISQKNKTPEPDGLPGEFYQTFKEEVTPILLNYYKKNRNGRETSKLILWSQHYLASKTKDPTKNENYRPICLMKMDAKILNKTLANNTLKELFTMTKWDLYLGYTGLVQYLWMNRCDTSCK